MPLQTRFEKNGFFPGKKCPPSIAGNLLLAGESCSQFWNGMEGVKGGWIGADTVSPSAFICG